MTNNRLNKCVYKYDVVIGPVADDGVFKVLSYYENGEWDKETVLKKLKIEKLEDQIVFSTTESLNYLRFLEMAVQNYD